MKYCPTCSQTYEDETASFCLKDGTPLVNKLSSSQLPETMFPGHPQSTAPTPALDGISSQSSDSVIPSSQVPPVQVQNPMSPSESQNDGSQNPVSTGASDQPSAGPIRLVFDLSQPASTAERAQPKSQPKLEPKPQPKSQLKSQTVRKRRLLLSVVGASLILGAAGIFLWWQHYKTTPAYSLALLVDAVHRNDNATVDQIVAMDRITDTFASQLTQNVLSQNPSAATDSGRKQLESSLTGLSPNIKQMVREEVEKQVRDEAAPSAGKSFLMIALAVPYKVGIKQAGDTAIVTPQAHPVEWTMQRSSGGPWTIVAVKDDTLASHILNQITNELPTTGGEKTPASASRQKNPPASVQQKNSTESSRAKKKERKKPREGIQIDLRRIPWPE